MVESYRSKFEQCACGTRSPRDQSTIPDIEQWTSLPSRRAIIGQRAEMIVRHRRPQREEVEG